MKEIYFFKKKSEGDLKCSMLDKYRWLSDDEHKASSVEIYHIIRGTEIVGIASSLADAEKGKQYIAQLDYRNDMPISIVRKPETDEAASFPDSIFIRRKRGIFGKKKETDLVPCRVKFIEV